MPILHRRRAFNWLTPIIIALSVSFSAVGQPSLRRDTVSKGVTATEIKATLSADSSVGWQYSGATRSWERSRAFSFSQPSMEFYPTWKTLNVRRMLIRKTWYPILSMNFSEGAYKYPATKREYTTYPVIHHFIIYPDTLFHSKLRALAQVLDTAQNNEYSPGVFVHSFRRYRSILRSTSTPDWNKALMSEGYAQEKSRCGFIFMPVKIDGVHSIRFLFYRCSDPSFIITTDWAQSFLAKAYEEMPFDKFLEFASGM